MEGVRFLEKVGEKWPETVRMILTGFCIPESVHSAISRAGISRVLFKPWDDNELLQQIRIAFHYSDSMRFAEINQCETCGKEGPPGQVQMHRPYYMCARCQNCYELLPGVILESLKRFISGNVL
jgi:response regulator RpfG family c-di-GMP phosphodiesterase